MKKNSVLNEFNNEELKDFIEDIKRKAPCFLEDTDDARLVRKFFKDKAELLRSHRFGWEFELSALAMKFNDEDSLNPLTNDLKKWRDKGTGARRNYVNDVQIKCLELASFLEKEVGVFEHLRVGDVSLLALKSKAALDKGVGFYHFMPNEALKVKPVKGFEDFEGIEVEEDEGIEGMLLVDFIRLVGNEAQGMMEIDRLDKNQNRGTPIEVDMRDFTKHCLIALNSTFKLEERPITVLAALVNMKYPDAAVGTETIKNWLRN